MTIHVQQMAAGREMDRLIAERVLGWDAERMEQADAFEREHQAEIEQYGRLYYVLEFQQGDDRGFREWSSNIAAAWDVVEHLAEKGWQFFVGSDDKHHRWAEFYEHRNHAGEHWIGTSEEGEGGGMRHAATALAICRAALLTVGAGI